MNQARSHAQALARRLAPGWLLVACAAGAAAFWAAGLALQAHALEAALAGGWCGAPGHVEQGVLGHCAPCWAALAALSVLLLSAAKSVRRAGRSLTAC